MQVCWTKAQLHAYIPSLPEVATLFGSHLSRHVAEWRKSLNTVLRSLEIRNTQPVVLQTLITLSQSVQSTWHPSQTKNETLNRRLRGP